MRRPQIDDRTEALSRLMSRIFEHEQRGEVVPCVDPRRGHWWLAEDREQQQAAAHACLTCPALGACTRYVEAHPEPVGVWAGRVPRDDRRREVTA